MVSPARLRLLFAARLFSGALGVGALLAGGTVAWAQGIGREIDAPAQEDRAADDPAAQVPSTKYLEVAQESLSVMRSNLTKGLDELKDAREKKDAVQLTCVNEQVTAMKGILRVSEDAIVSLQEALSAADTERARYEFRKIQASKRKMDDLLQAAVNCAGAEATESNTSVEMEVDPNLAIIDPYYGDPSFFFDPASTLVGADTSILGDEDPPTVRPPPASDVLN
jgi:hypothetical protein